MYPTQFANALQIAERYFALSGIDPMTLTSLGAHILSVWREGETRTLVIANRAIERMERELDAELETSSEQLEVTFKPVALR